MSSSVGSDSSGSVGSSVSVASVGFVASVNSDFDLTVKTALIIENAPIDIPASSMPSV